MREKTSAKELTKSRIIRLFVGQAIKSRYKNLILPCSWGKKHRVLGEKNTGQPGQESENAMKPNTVGREVGQRPDSHPVKMPAIKAGFVCGTVLLTRDGEMPVEFLSPGDQIITRPDHHPARSSPGMRAWSDWKTSVTVAYCPVQSHLPPARWGHTRPDQELIRPAAQRVLIRDWRAQAMVVGQALVDGEFIRDLGPQKMLLHQLAL